MHAVLIPVLNNQEYNYGSNVRWLIDIEYLAQQNINIYSKTIMIDAMDTAYHSNQ